MVGFTGFNSACFYRYCRIDLKLLRDNLGDDDLAHRTVIAFLRSAIDAIPTGKQNAFAAQNPTSFALAVVRRDGMCWNLANAFETPVQAKKGDGYISESIHKLDALWGALTGFYDDADVAALSAYNADLNPTQLTHLESAKHATVSEWLEPIKQAIAEG
jgi:CRISPR system Cascade subunit CasC